MTEHSPRLVKSTKRSLQILEFIRERGAAQLTDISTALGIGHSTAYNHLATLEEDEWLVKEDGQYKLGCKHLQFGRSVRRNIPFFQIVRRLTNELSDQTDFEVEFLVEERGRIVSIFDFIPTNAAYGNIADDWHGVGISYNMTNTASGKAILAEMSDDRVNAIIDEHGFDPKTPYSVTDRDTLFQQLEEARQKGYAKAHQEVHEGFENIAVAVKYPNGSIFGAIAIGWPSYMFDDSIDREIITRLVDTKEQLEAEIADDAVV